ncbi:PUA-like domain-containing protein [Elsinoe ampelina]|uniref:PUA-like domain-containing protein n=1 Tax=Elsinoe ampelina TaxID=302913 RepID=A0A6A6GIN6_9PEZI|nr:PUA-like domain-containing protein [Elsinoe ampelina]
MNSVQATQSPSSDSGGHQSSLAHAQAQAPAGLMQQDFQSHPEPSQASGLKAHEQARALVRLIQCPKCSKPFSTPVTLPCGRSVCRSCLPESHERERITWPDLPDRRRAVKCPFTTCGEEHTVADCSLDVVLTKVMDSVAEVVAKQNSLSDMQNITEHLSSDVMQYHSSQGEPGVAIRSHGRLVATYNAAASGQLQYDVDISYESLTGNTDEDKTADDLVLAHLLDTCHRELDCQVCYNLMLDPVTTSCGHTLCRKCLVRSLDHSLHCPVCRRIVLIPPSLQSHPSNKTLGDLLDGLVPDLVAARREAITSEETTAMGEFDTPLFVVTLGFPGCPTFLRVFEPRYRLMLRRALEGNRTFGIVMYNQVNTPQGELGHSHFMQYGTLLRIENAQLMPDGTSIIETRGVSRFKILVAGTLDGYSVGRVERVEDVPLSEEEAIETQETSLPPTAENDVEGLITRMSTQQLLDLGHDFIRRMQARSAPWLHEGILQAYGGPPDDASVFPYWFASILPINDVAKYQMLQTNSVRQRLKITARWIKLMESQR